MRSRHAVGWFTLIGLTLAAVMTAFYMFRLYFLTFTGEYRSADQSGDHPYDAHPHESPPSMTIPLVVLGFGALFAGFLGLPHVVPITGNASLQAGGVTGWTARSPDSRFPRRCRS